MTCEARDELLLEYAMGSLDAVQAAELRTHLDGGCVKCAGRLAEHEAMLVELTLAARPAVPSHSARQRLLKRVQQSEGGVDPVNLRISPRSTRQAGSWRLPFVVGAIAAGLFVSLALVSVIRTQRNTIVALQQTRAVDEQLIHDLQSAGVDSKRTIELISNPQSLIVRVPGAAQPNAVGSLVYSPATREGHFFAQGLSQLPGGKIYELWLIDEKGAKVPAGTFSANAAGAADLPLKSVAISGHLVAVAVTDEPSAMAAPTGSFQLVQLKIQ